MSELLDKHEVLPAPEKHELITAHAEAEGEHEPIKPEASPLKRAEGAREEIAETASSDIQLQEKLQAVGAENSSQDVSPRLANQELRQVALRRELKNIRRKLRAPQKVLSNVIHQPVIRAVSESASKTVSRPSGLLGGGLVAFMGTSGYLYMAKHYGFRYNYMVFLLLLAGGFALGLILEFLVWVATGSRRRAHD
jgi:hypothetical protein